MKTMFYEIIDDKERYMGNKVVLEKISGQKKSHTFCTAGCLEAMIPRPKIADCKRS